MSNLSALRSELAKLERELDALEEQRDREKELLEKAKKRISDIRPILRNLQNDFDGNCRSINRKMDGLENDLTDAIKGISNITSLTADIAETNEKEPESDTYLSVSISKLVEEIDALETYAEERKKVISRLNVKISELRSKISRLRWQIQQEEAKETLENIADKLGF